AMFLLPLVVSLLHPTSATSGPDFNYGAHPRFVCTPIPADTDPSCFPTAGTGAGSTGPGGSNHQNVPPSGWWGASDEAKATILHLRESLVQQKEIILDQRETIRELTAKLTLCEGAGRGPSLHDEHHGSVSYSHHNSQHHHSSVQRSDGGYGGGHNHGKDKHGTAGDSTSTMEQLERMLHALKERLSSLQKRNSTSTYSSSLKELLQRKISTLEEQLHHHTTALGSSADHHDEGQDSDHRSNETEDHSYLPHTGYRTGFHSNKLETMLNQLHLTDAKTRHFIYYFFVQNSHNTTSTFLNQYKKYIKRCGKTMNSIPFLIGYNLNIFTFLKELPKPFLPNATSNKKHSKKLDAFQISFPMRTNYMYGRMKRTLLQEIFALTLCLWMKAGVGPGLGTPFSYSAPGQANELVLIEWGNNPIELLIDDKAVTLPLSLSDGKWHHVCVTWTTREGQWEAYQDGVQRGSGTNLSPWHSIKPGGVFILGQEQDTLGGRFDATQSYVGEMSDLHMWSHALSAADIYSLASCGSHLRGDVIDWSESEVELHGGVARYPFDPCH
uniref:Neuronal pentraxin-1-like n=1 Tax=Poecilia formosa TaxID=48698 RepID=A0A096MAM3_POEFO